MEVCAGDGERCSVAGALHHGRAGATVRIGMVTGEMGDALRCCVCIACVYGTGDGAACKTGWMWL